MERQLKKPYERTRISTEISEDAQKTKALQSEKRSSDINHIVSKAIQTGQLPVLMQRQPIAEMPSEQSYQEMLNKVVFAQQAFQRLPSNIRDQFENRPENMLKAIENAKNSPETKELLENLGIIQKPEPIVDPKPIPVSIITDPIPEKV